MPLYQIVSVTYSSDVEYPNTAGLYNMLGKKVSTAGYKSLDFYI